MKEEDFKKRFSDMKLDLHYCYSILYFFLIVLSIYVFVYHQCNSDDSECLDKREILDNFVS